MNDNKNNNKEEELIKNSASISFLIEVNKGVINVCTSGPKITYLIVNVDDESIIIKETRDPFMHISGMVRSYLSKWKKQLKTT